MFYDMFLHEEQLTFPPSSGCWCDFDVYTSVCTVVVLQTAHTLILRRLIKYTTVQERARKEIDALYDEDTLPSWADEQTMPFVRAGEWIKFSFRYFCIQNKFNRVQSD
jgi:hypothetical protein